MSEQSTDLRETVRRRYAAAAAQVTEGGNAGCGPEPVEADENFGSTLYGADERDTLPAEAVAASLGCGNPTAVAEPVEADENFGSTLYGADERDTLPAEAVAASLGCGNPTAVAEPVEADENFGSTLYGADERDTLPAEAVAASLGCGNPTAVAELREGERVLDLGSGGGIDVLLSARRVGPTGRAYGLDMTEEMLALAVANAAKAGATNVEFLKGTIEAIPLPANTVDVVISNCVINLSVDKPAVFAETFRVLRSGGRIGVSDVVADDALTAAQRARRGDDVGCIVGALSFAEYRAGLEAAGFTGVEIVPTHPVADGLHSAIVRATKPTADRDGTVGEATT